MENKNQEPRCQPPREAGAKKEYKRRKRTKEVSNKKSQGRLKYWSL
jgi:hypothetical protein